VFLLAAKQQDWQGTAGAGQKPRRNIRFSKHPPGQSAFVGQSQMKRESGIDSKRAATIFVGRWTVKILSLLKQRPFRHGELRRRLGSISQRMLTRTLRNLESSGLLTRRVTRSKSLAVEYSLTKLGRTFLVPLTCICGWANRHNKGLNAVIRLQ